jgi:hypothetical protein
LDDLTKAALAPFDPIDFIGKPMLRAVLKRALDKAQRESTAA